MKNLSFICTLLPILIVSGFAQNATGLAEGKTTTAAV
jgi:hypothetical protein